MSWNRPRLASDNVATHPCDCLVCKAAGVALRSVRVPADEFSTVPRWLHGDELRRWWDAREGVRTAFAQLRGKLTMPPATGGTEPRR